MYLLLNERTVIQVFEDEPVLHQDLKDQLVELDGEVGDYIVNGENVGPQPSDFHDLTDGEWVESMSDARDASIAKVVSYAESMRNRFTDGAGTGKLSGFQINSDILNLIDSGVAFDSLDGHLQSKVNLEVEVDDRYSKIDDLLTVWREKRGALSIASAWVGAVENNTISALKVATSIQQLDEILSTSKSMAEAKAAELLNTP
ncbi:MAG: hypothetical protein ACJAYF_003554 [Arenicella sp.]|jgi:hypothetical protein